ncbi:hypothetical protein Poly51_57490 [Rubripirellula tenax]|uniref:Phytase-like domain-containing protein n=1 Tax=Rubripirellula tenax TaxID=2528015 RepID=A0A5C6E9J0_9BACT|nr:esterase-like activity of phytase family protein [Rubripirellula tenax]TWU46353.1 hypothetical protein Poly51_57490 [Rubripirellula tenax]
MMKWRSAIAMDVVRSVTAPIAMFGFSFFVAAMSSDAAEPRLSSLRKPNEAALSPVELLGVIEIAGNATDECPIEGKLEDGSPLNQFGGLSGIEYDRRSDRFILLADRGAGDGLVNFPCRFHETDLTLHPATATIQMKLIETRLLRSADGKNFLGSLESHGIDFAATHTHGGDLDHFTALDPEGIRCMADGNLLVSDEYGPRILKFSPTGSLIGKMVVPNHFGLHSDGGVYGSMGSVPNRGLEGIAITPMGSRIVATVQSPLVQDGRIENGRVLGRNCRWLVLDDAGDVESEVIYQLDDETTGLSEILAIDETRFLVLERDSVPGADAKNKRIYIADLSNATDVKSHPFLKDANLPASIRAVEKHLLVDLLDERFGIRGESAPEKPEGMCWGKPLPDGRRTLWVCCDNDFVASNSSWIYAFGIDSSVISSTEHLTQPSAD